MNHQKTAVVTGANRGLGLETCRQLARKGYQVILTSRDPGDGGRAAEMLNIEGAQVTYHPLDVTSADSIQRLYEFVSRKYGAADILVNNAGVYLNEDRNVLQVSMEVMELTLQTNTLGALRLCQVFIPEMVEQNYGRVVNVSSRMGEIRGMSRHNASYRLSKLALNGLTLMLADAVHGKNVLVNAVCPGWVRTDMGGPGAPRSLATGAESIVWAATLPDGGPNGGFFRDGKVIDW